MSESKMREALESLVKLHRKHFGLDGAWDAEIIKAEYLLAQQPSDVVELTDDEIMSIDSYMLPLSWARKVIAAHEAKQDKKCAQPN